jgi:bifunctional non-homologous end joining protein LigD
MPKLTLPPAAVHSALPASIVLQIVTSTVAPPDGDGWLHEIKHDGHRLVAVVGGPGGLTLISRNGFDRTPLFRGPFGKLAGGSRTLVLDGEIAVPDARGVTHIDGLNDAIAGRSEQLAYFAFDLLHLDGQDLRRCPIEERKALLCEVLEAASYERIVYVDHIIGRGAELFDKVRAVGAEGIVSKRLGSLYRGTRPRDWLKTKCHEVGQFIITGFQELGEGRLEAVRRLGSRWHAQACRAGSVRPGRQGPVEQARQDPLRLST